MKSTQKSIVISYFFLALTVITFPLMVFYFVKTFNGIIADKKIQIEQIEKDFATECVPGKCSQDYKNRIENFRNEIYLLRLITAVFAGVALIQAFSHKFIFGKIGTVLKETAKANITAFEYLFFSQTLILISRLEGNPVSYKEILYFSGIILLVLGISSVDCPFDFKFKKVVEFVIKLSLFILLFLTTINTL